MKNLFEMLQAIFGKNIISKTIGTRTNVIKLPSNKASPLKNEFDVFKSAENPDVFEKLKKVIEDEAPYISRMNDAEKLIYEGNVRRLHDYLVSTGQIKPAITAEVIGLTTKEPISGKGLESLVEEAGQTSPPGTLIGDIQSRINKLKGLGKEMEKQTGEKATLTDVLKDIGASQQSMSRLNDEGLVRSTAREILINDIKAGKIKNITVSEAINMGEPLDPFRQIYGEGALEQLDSLIPNFRGLKTEMEAEKLARSKFKFEPDENRLPGSVSIEEGKKAEQEYGIKLTPKEGEEETTKGLDYLTGQKPPEEKANGGRVGFKIGSGKKILKALGFNTRSEFEKLNLKHDKDIVKAADEIGANLDDPKMGAQQIAEVYADMKFGKDYYDLPQNQQLDLYSKAYNYLTDMGILRRQSNAVTKYNAGEELGQFDQKMIDQINNRQQKEILNNFDIKDREPNAKGGSIGLGYLIGE